MELVLSVIAWSLLAFAMFALVCNYAFEIQIRIEKRRRDGTHQPAIPLLVPIVCAIASTLLHFAGMPQPAFLFFALVVLDPPFWQFLRVPFVFARRSR